MRYTTEEGGRLNNFAIEPKMYKAEPPTKVQQRNYIFLGIGALALVATLMFVAVSVS
ncbi:ssl1498 family light-harvesting-like protein [Kovacikia minuta CCNUW1]|uniref:photosystem II assembly protein Psb34 n=1 Tax=Kovacikia minuta TaxID=2931930 RepID=UPI001CC9BB6E|nr:ssl1498 family light-harvesting-like protein [Kovacikia minuta]UBF27825.1 ssl1498 family light-harvesting-like protein [Kovacikia minuta CCNUW1]